MSETRDDGESRAAVGGGVEELSPEARELLERLLAERRAGQGPASAPGPESAGVAPAPGPIERFPISAAQRRLWRLGTLAEGTPWGNLPLTFWVRGPLRIDVLEAALRDLLDRQSVLETRYRHAGEGVFGVLEESATPILKTWAPAARSQILARVRERASRALDPGSESLFQAVWLPLSSDQEPEREGMLLLLTHHLVTDGWSLALMLRELSQAYAARVEGRGPDLPRLKASFADLAAAEPSERTPTPQGVAYWRDRLAGAPREVPLPIVGRPAGPGAFQSAKVDGAISVEASASLRKLAAAAGVTPFAAWLGLFQTLLARYTGEPDVVVGTTVSIRDTADRERLVGNFGNNVLLRMRLHDIGTLGEALSRIRETLPRDLAHQTVELEDLLRGRGKFRVPRLNVLFMLRDGSPAEHLAFPGCSIDYVPTPVGSLTLDLALDVFDRGDRGFSFAIEHRLARVDREGAEALAGDLERLVEAIVDRPDLPLEDLPIRHGLWADAPDPSASAPGTSAESARRGAGSRGADPTMTESETFLAHLWRDALDLEDVSPHDNFFELGGHSLLAIAVLDEIEEKRGLRLTPVDFVSQTLAQLAASLAEAGPSEVRSVAAMGRVLPAPRGTTLEPVRLDGGRLSAMLHAPADGAPRSLGVICPPVLYEHQLCQRSLRSLAERLAAEGIASLRLDYRGTGDSGGDLSDATVEAWSEDIRMAEEFLTVEYGRVPEFRFGLRIGATLALAAEAEGHRTVFAWAPILDGSEYMVENEATHADWYRRYGVHHGRHADAGSATGRVLGQPLSESARASLSAIRLDPLPSTGGALYVIETEGCELRPDERSALDSLAPAPSIWSVPGPAPWLEDPDAVSPSVPARALEQIAAAIREALS